MRFGTLGLAGMRAVAPAGRNCANVDCVEAAPGAFLGSNGHSHFDALGALLTSSTSPLCQLLPLLPPTSRVPQRNPEAMQPGRSFFDIFSSNSAGSAGSAGSVGSAGSAGSSGGAGSAGGSAGSCGVSGALDTHFSQCPACKDLPEPAWSRDGHHLLSVCNSANTCFDSSVEMVLVHEASPDVPEEQRYVVVLFPGLQTHDENRIDAYRRTRHYFKTAEDVVDMRRVTLLRAWWKSSRPEDMSSAEALFSVMGLCDNAFWRTYQQARKTAGEVANILKAIKDPAKNVTLARRAKVLLIGHSLGARVVMGTLVQLANDGFTWAEASPPVAAAVAPPSTAAPPPAPPESELRARRTAVLARGEGASV